MASRGGYVVRWQQTVNTSLHKCLQTTNSNLKVTLLNGWRFAVTKTARRPLQIGVDFISRKSARYSLHALELKYPENAVYLHTKIHKDHVTAVPPLALRVCCSRIPRFVEPRIHLYYCLTIQGRISTEHTAHALSSYLTQSDPAINEYH